METGYAGSATEERDALILKHIPQVRWIASCFHDRLGGRVEEEDLFSAGLLGLISAVDRFDASRDACLRTFAEHRIRGSILDSIRGLDGVPPHRRKQLRRLQEATDTVASRTLREPEEEEIAAEAGLTLAEYHALLDDLKGVSLGSLDVTYEDGSEGRLARYIADEREEPADVMIERREMRALLTAEIKNLPQNEQLVLDLYFHRELTLAEIGRVMDLHVSRISQIKTQAIVRLRFRIGRALRSGRVLPA